MEPSSLRVKLVGFHVENNEAKAMNKMMKHCGWNRRSALISEGILCTYNLAFFFGPGLPRGFGRPSGVNATAELLFVPFFLGPSVGGGIDDVGAGVPLAIGVFDAEVGGLPPVEPVATGRVFGVGDNASFEGDRLEGDSPLTTFFSANL
jgi:hypothetical protein